MCQSCVNNLSVSIKKPQEKKLHDTTIGQNDKTENSNTKNYNTKTNTKTIRKNYQKKP